MYLKTISKVLAVSSIVGVASCASQIMTGYVGKSISEPMLDYGKPTAVFDLPDGRRAFQWQMNSVGSIPITTPQTTTIYGSGELATATTQNTSYMPYSTSCAYTLFGQEQGNDWIVVGFREPRLECE